MKFPFPILKKSPDRTAGKGKLTVPAHVAIIMDGNRRWADGRKLPRVAGYKIGLEALKDIYNECLDLGIKYLTVYAFSTENKSRPKDEVSYLKWLFVEAINKEINELIKKNVRVRILGRLNEPEMQAKIVSAEKATEKNDGLFMQIMYNYGGRAEIVDATKKIVELAKKDPGLKIDEELISNNVYLAGIPDPDLLIRTGGDNRVSNFLLSSI